MLQLLPTVTGTAHSLGIYSYVYKFTKNEKSGFSWFSVPTIWRLQTRIPYLGSPGFALNVPRKKWKGVRWNYLSEQKKSFRDKSTKRVAPVRFLGTPPLHLPRGSEANAHRRSPSWNPTPRRVPKPRPMT